MNSTPFFSFSDQCFTEWELAEEWVLVCKEAMKFAEKEPKVASQMIENFKLLAYREWRKSFESIDSKDNALWRYGEE